MERHDRLKDLSVFAEPESHCGYLAVAGIPFLWLVGTICRREIKHFSKGEKMMKNAVMQPSLTFISATGRKNSIPLYWDSYIIMNYDGTRWNSRQLFLIDDTACAAIPKRNDGKGFMRPYILSQSGYPRPPITHHQRNNIPPCPCEQSGKKAMSGGIHSTGFPCPNAAGFCLYSGRKGSVTEVAGYCPTKKTGRI